MGIFLSHGYRRRFWIRQADRAVSVKEGPVLVQRSIERRRSPRAPSASVSVSHHICPAAGTHCLSREAERHDALGTDPGHT